MSEPENFLTRWSRRKRQSEQPAEQDLPDGDRAASPENRAREGAPAEPDEVDPSPTGEANPPAFDLASLPAIESITATTDIRPFLAPGVPTALRTAALRRVWVADPKIRDFIEIAENQWDFATPDSVPGFATFKLRDDVSRFVAQLEHKAEDVPEARAKSPADENSAANPAPEPTESRAATDEYTSQVASAAVSDHETSVVQRNEDDAAVPKEPADVQPANLPTRRSRGGALPQ